LQVILTQIAQFEQLATDIKSLNLFWWRKTLPLTI